MRSIKGVRTPPIVSIPKVNGVTSSKSTSLTSPCKTPAWTAAPKATTSSGLTEIFGFLPKNSSTFFCTKGIRVIPPTKIISSMSFLSSLASAKALRHGSKVFSTKSPINSSSLARVNFITKCFGPLSSVVING